MSKYYYDEVSAERPIKWIEKYCTSTTGEPFRLLEYQKRDIIRPMFGWKNEDGTFKHRFCYIEIGKGNGKSGLLTAIGAYLCYAAGETNAEIYAIASSREQAGIVHEDIKKIVRASPELEKRTDVLRNTILYREKGNKIVAVSSDIGGSHGWRPHALIFDELHTYKNAELFDSYTAGLIKRKNSMAFILTTAGKTNTFAETIHNKALAIKNGSVENPYWHVAIYHADAEDPPFEYETFIKANPAYGVLIRPEDFDVIVSNARDTPSSLASYKQLHLNVWTGKREDWISAEDWRKCDLSIPETEYSHLPCWGGLDLASVRDITAFSIMWKLPDGRIKWKVWFWVPEQTVTDRTQKENHQYQEWVDAGFIRTTPGNATDLDQVGHEIVEISRQYNMQCIYFDRMFMMGAVKPLNDAGIELIGHAQTTTGMNTPVRELERAIISANIDHEGNPVLDWMSSNCVVYTDTSGNMKLDKSNAKEKIDGPVSGLMAMTGIIENNKEVEIPADWTPTFF